MYTTDTEPTCCVQQLDDAALSSVLSKLDAHELVTAAQARAGSVGRRAVGWGPYTSATALPLSQVCRRWRDVSGSAITWRPPFERAYPEWAPRLEASQPSAAVAWRSEFRQRQLADRSWASGAPTLSVALRGHGGPVFAATFLQPPFPQHLAISAGVLGRHDRAGAEQGAQRLRPACPPARLPAGLLFSWLTSTLPRAHHAELTVWDLRREVEGVGRLGWQIAPAAGGSGSGRRQPAEGEGDELAGAFFAAQRPSRRQLVVCGFTPAVHVFALHQQSEEVGEENGDERSRGDPALDEVEQRMDAVLRLRASSNLRYTERLDPENLPSPGEAWRSRLLASLVGHDAPCPSARCVGDDAVLTASFDGSVKLWRLPPALGDDAGMPPRHVLPAASLEDSERSRLRPLELHSRAACAVAASPDLTEGASGGNDTLLRLWDLEEQQAGGVGERAHRHHPCCCPAHASGHAPPFFDPVRSRNPRSSTGWRVTRAGSGAWSRWSRHRWLSCSPAPPTAPCACGTRGAMTPVWPQWSSRGTRARQREARARATTAPFRWRAWRCAPTGATRRWAASTTASTSPTCASGGASVAPCAATRTACRAWRRLPTATACCLPALTATCDSGPLGPERRRRPLGRPAGVAAAAATLASCELKIFCPLSSG